MIRVIDFETTGLPEDPVRAICEVGWIDLDLIPDAMPKDPKTFFVNPAHPIPPHIRAVHHISDKDVAAAMPPDQAVAFLLKEDCGMGSDGQCSMAGSEFCDWDCPRERGRQ